MDLFSEIPSGTLRKNIIVPMDDAGVVDTTLRRPSERNEVDACRFAVTADSW